MPVHQVGLPADMDAFLEARRAPWHRDRRGRRLRDRSPVQGTADRLARLAGLLLAAPAQGHHHRRGRHDRRAGSRRRRATAAAARARDGHLRPGPPHGHRRGDRGLPRARLQLPHDRHAGHARALPAAESSTGSSSAGAGSPSATPRRSRAIPHLEAPYDPPYAQRTWQSYCVRIAPGAPVGRTELMRRLLRDGIATRRGVMAIHEEAAYAGRPPTGPAEIDRRAAPTPRRRHARR